jgi:GTPase involved in cell partitioning and DNA repair
LIIAGNKLDLFEDEEVDEEEVKQFAKEIGAYHRLMSSLTGDGVKEVFNYIGCKLIDPNYDENNNNKDNNNHCENSFKLNKKHLKKKNNPCC